MEGAGTCSREKEPLNVNQLEQFAHEESTGAEVTCRLLRRVTEIYWPKLLAQKVVQQNIKFRLG